MFGGISQAEIMRQANAAIKRELSTPASLANINADIQKSYSGGFRVPNMTRASIAELIPIDTIVRNFNYREAIERIAENHARMMQGVITLRSALEHKKAKPPLILPRIFQSLNAWLSSLKAWIDLLIARTKHTEIFGIDDQDFEHFTIAAELF